jgi:hypothetical protein
MKSETTVFVGRERLVAVSLPEVSLGTFCHNGLGRMTFCTLVPSCSGRSEADREGSEE